MATAPLPKILRVEDLEDMRVQLNAMLEVLEQQLLIATQPAGRATILTGEGQVYQTLGLTESNYATILDMNTATTDQVRAILGSLIDDLYETGVLR